MSKLLADGARDLPFALSFISSSLSSSFVVVVVVAAP